MQKLFEQSGIESILGLPWMSTTPETSTKTVSETFQLKLFGVCLGKHARWQSIGYSGSEITVSWYGVESNSPSRIYWGRAPWQSMSYMPLVRDARHWAVPLSNIKVDGGTGGTLMPDEVACWHEPCVAVIDTGASGILAPSSHAYGLYQRFGGVKGDCSNFEQLPTVHFRLGGPGAAGIDVTLKPKHYVKRLKYISGALATESCKTQFAPITLDGYGVVPVWVLGVPFLQEYVVEFDRSQYPARIGVAPHPGECGDSSGQAALTSTLPQRAEDRALHQHSLDSLPDALSLLGLGGGA